MSKVVKSISMDAELADQLQAEAEGFGDSFSAIVCRMAKVGLAMSDAAVRKVIEQAAESEPLINIPPTPPEQDPDIRHYAEQEAGWPKLTDDMEPAEKVYSCVTVEHRSLQSIADYTGVGLDEVGIIVEQLADEGQPIILRRVGGEWQCWQEEN